MRAALILFAAAAATEDQPEAAYARHMLAREAQRLYSLTDRQARAWASAASAPSVDSTSDGPGATDAPSEESVDAAARRLGKIGVVFLQDDDDVNIQCTEEIYFYGICIWSNDVDYKNRVFSFGYDDYDDDDASSSCAKVEASDFDCSYFYRRGQFRRDASRRRRGCDAETSRGGAATGTVGRDEPSGTTASPLLGGATLATTT